MLKALMSLAGLFAMVVAQSDDPSYFDPSLSDAQLLALHDFLQSVADFQYPTNITTADNVTRTAEGYILGSTTEPYFNIEWRETQSAWDYLSFPDRNLEVTTFINPIPTGVEVTVTPHETPVAKMKKRMVEKRAAEATPPPSVPKRRSLRARDQFVADICPVPKTITVIEWIDCAASPEISDCGFCPATTSCDTCDPPTTVTACPLSTQSCDTCKFGYEVILLGTPGPSDPPCSKVTCTECENGYKYVVVPSGPTTPTASVAAGDFVLTIDYGSGYTGPTVTTITALQSDYAFIGTLMISSNSKLIVSTQFALDAEWSSSMTWPVLPEPTDDSEYDDAITDELETPTQTHAETYPTYTNVGSDNDTLPEPSWYNSSDPYLPYVTGSAVPPQRQLPVNYR